MKLHRLPLTMVLLPFTAIYGSYALNVYLDVVTLCIPNIEGCVSISRAARSGDGLFLFRALMMPYAALLAIFWGISRSWLRTLGDTESIRPTLMMIIGIAGAVSLLTYVDFLGTSGSTYRLIRRFGVIFFFAFTGFAELILVSRLYAMQSETIDKIRNAKRLMLTTSIGLLLLAAVHIFLSLCVEDGDHLENANEWNFAILLMVFSLGTYYAWKQTKVSLTVSSLNTK